MKRYLNIFIAIAALCIFTGCYEEIDLVEDTTYTTIFYTTDDNEVANITTSYNGMHVISNTYTNGEGKVVVKGKMTHLYPYFSGCDNLVSVTIPKGVASIGENAFYSCDNLKRIVVPEGVKEIEPWAFYNCDRLASVTLPSTLVTIGSNAFYDCKAIANIVIPDNVTTIYASAFNDCIALKSVTIGRSVTTIGDYAFEGCSNLKTVINNSSLHFTKGSSNYGYVAYYADKITQKNINKEYVDLGLPSGVKWATFNIGATKPEEVGEYYCWGETTPNIVNNTKYVNISDISGNATYDAARAIWGSGWRIPTKSEFSELVNNCTWSWTTYNGVKGYRIYGPNGNSIFLPDTSRDYWSSTPTSWEYLYDAAYILKMESNLVSSYYYAYRDYARYIRPVTN